MSKDDVIGDVSVSRATIVKVSSDEFKMMLESKEGGGNSAVPDADRNKVAREEIGKSPLPTPKGRGLGRGSELYEHLLSMHDSFTEPSTLRVWRDAKTRQIQRRTRER